MGEQRWDCLDQWFDRQKILYTHIDPIQDYLNMSALAVQHLALRGNGWICWKKVSFFAFSSLLKLKSILVYFALGGARTSASYLQLQNLLDKFVSSLLEIWSLVIHLMRKWETWTVLYNQFDTKDKSFLNHRKLLHVRINHSHKINLMTATPQQQPCSSTYTQVS